MLMRRLIFIRKTALFIGLALICSISVTAQEETSEEKLSVNRTDSKGKKHGMWYFSKAARMGEAGYIEFGSYEHGARQGVWYKMDKNSEDLISIETYKKGMLNGEVKYFDMGKLYCVGNYYALNPLQKYDTIVVTDPNTLLESYRVLATESGSIRHGLWRYYDPETGYMIKEEEYVADELVYKHEFKVLVSKDSIIRNNYQKKMPHNKKENYQPPPGKRSFTR